ncbi:MAG: 16S rRNA (cytosine(1402)-N(4))-methyltransferase [Magnetovibrio sp.]|nr:16S rRNA (cytosine(1402)-N(4))-methyltransferase [Magnetovibrio sp.]
MAVFKKASAHTPVLLSEVLEVLCPRNGAIYLDGTFGAGGYSTAILESANCQVFGIDRDPSAVKIGNSLAKRYTGRLCLLQGCYGNMVNLMAERGVDKVDGIALDIGVSSMQIDDVQRGFSFRTCGPLDMRMGIQADATAAEVVNTLSEDDLNQIIYTYGDERASRSIAAAIVKYRVNQPFTTTGQLAGLVRRIVKKSKDGLDPATRTFQALRIYVNDEIGELSRGLAAAEQLLNPGGRLAVVSFHSLEDRKVKKFLRSRSGQGSNQSRHLPRSINFERPPSFNLLKRGIIKPSKEEIAVNPRARSAKLRAAERTNFSPWPGDNTEIAA